jgi:hypothetical protein
MERTWLFRHSGVKGWRGNRPEVPQLRAPFADACLVLCALAAFCGSARAQTPGAAPGGSPGAASVLDDIRRRFDRPGAMGLQGDNGSGGTAPHTNGGAAISPGALPLLLPLSTWTDHVLGTPVPEHLVLDAALKTRGPALFYYGLFSLDDETRTWLAAHPQLVAELSGPAAAAFVVAAPGMRVRGSTLQPPGGAAARKAWESLVGQSIEDPARFISALLSREDGRIALFYGTMAGLSPPQVHTAFRLDGPEGDRVDAAKRLMAAFAQIMLRRRIHDHVFWRPVLDPALLITHLRREPGGRPVVPGSRRFWRAVFDDAPRVFPKGSRDPHRENPGEPADVAWLASQIFSGHRVADRKRYDMVLFVSRMAAHDPRWATHAAIGAVRAAGRYPALMLSLERARVTELAVHDAAARRADMIAGLGEYERARRTLIQFQGALALVFRAARVSAAPTNVSAAVSSLAAIELDEHGEYDGRLVGWLEGWLASRPRSTDAPDDAVRDSDLDRAALAAVAGPPARDPLFVDWEGARYRVDLAAAEARRITRHLGNEPRPWLSTASTLVAAATEGSRGGLHGDEATRLIGVLEEFAALNRWDDDESPDRVRAPDTYRDALSGLKRAAKGTDARTGDQLPPVLRRLADELLGRGLMELAYAAAFGSPDRATISAGEAAARHSFILPFQGAPSAAWQLPATATVPNRPWHLSGSLLGLDIALAEFSLVRLSRKPPPRPTLNSDLRRVLVEAVPLVEAASLNARDRAAMVAAIREGRVRLAAARTAADASALADEMNLSPQRRTLLVWSVTAARDDLDGLLSRTELLWLGQRGRPLDPAWHGWGVPATARTGCLCLDIVDRQPWEALAGRVSSGTLASGFPDLNLRLAELLEELQMPAPLLGPVLGPATLELVEHAVMRDADDRRGLLDFVDRLRRERVEEYLALLTDEGPLVPIERGDDR